MKHSMSQRILSLTLVVGAALLASGCYHAQVTTGATAGPTVIDTPWAMGFVYGLVPPAAIDAAAACPNGVARVETRLSFLNQLVGALSAGIITPMHITITCAAGGMSAVDPVSFGAERPNGVD
jgi:hypothetical protein